MHSHFNVLNKNGYSVLENPYNYIIMTCILNMLRRACWTGRIVCPPP